MAGPDIPLAPAAVGETAGKAVAAVTGQVAVATTTGDVCALHLLPEDPPACPEAVTAILDADWVVLGPGSVVIATVPVVLRSQLVIPAASTIAAPAIRTRILIWATLGARAF